MEYESRSSKVGRNLIYGAGGQLIQSVFPFITRTVFIYTLGKSFLGISSLFASILSVLSLAELGLGNVVVYSLYQPLANHDHDRVKAYVDFYRTIYRVIAGVVFSVGLLLLPFLKVLVRLPEEIPLIRLYYMLYVTNSALSYLCVYKTSVINADQKQYLISKYTTISVLLLNISQSIILITLKDFTLYLVVQLVFTFCLNFALSKKADKLYGLNQGMSQPLSKAEKKSIFTDTISMLSYKFGGIFLNSTDSVYISVLVDTITVGLYANYTILESFLNKFITLLYDALCASVGNLNATETEEKKKNVFDTLVMIFVWVGSIGFAGFFLASNNVVRLWIGESYCINTFAVFALSLRFYLPIVLYPVWMYRNTAGLFKQTRNILLYAGVLNLLLSYPLGKWYGLGGILLATSVARLATSFWFEPSILYKTMFPSCHVFEYFEKIFLSVIILIITCGLGLKVSSLIVDSVLLQLVFEVLVSIVLPSIFWFTYYRKKNEWHYFTHIIRRRLFVK